MKLHWKVLLEGLALIVVIFVVVVGASNYWKWRSDGGAKKLYAATLLKAGSDEQIKALGDIADGFSRTAAGKRSMMMLGDIYFKRGDFDKALEKFKDVAGHSRNQPIVLIAALHRMAEIELAKGDLEAAYETYVKAAADPHNLVASFSRYRAAEVMEKAGKYDKAAELYRQIIADGEKDAAMKQKSEERLLWLVSEKLVKG